jgi:CRISPR-associated protein Cst1
MVYQTEGGDERVNNIFTYTGNPFVDAGVTAMLAWLEKNKPEDIEDCDVEKLIDEITDLYTKDEWNKTMYSIFPNSKLTNPSIKDKKARYDEFLKDLLSGISTLDSSGNCIACGRRISQRQFTKTQVPLTGTSDFVNFFSYGKEGADYCSACVLAIQFAPLVLYKTNNLVCLQSDNKEVEMLYARKCRDFINRQKSSKKYTGCNDEGYTNTVNALFHLATDIILTYDRREWHQKSTNIRLYCFTNYNQPPIDNLSIYDMPDRVFKFLAYALQHQEKDNWKEIIKRGYRVKKKEALEDEEKYKNVQNDVYERLLAGRSILRCFIDDAERRTLVSWGFLEYYMREVRGMDEKRLQTIKRVSDSIADLIREKGNVRRLTQLETAKSYGDLRNVLRLVIKDRISEGMEQPLFTIDEYEKYLFPDGNLSWRETQDLIIFRLYEILHSWLVENRGIEEFLDENQQKQEEEELIYE